MQTDVIGPVERLTQLRADVRRAMMAREDMRAAETTPDRDCAIIDYSRAVDAIYAHLAALEEIGALDELERAATVFWGR